MKKAIIYARVSSLTQVKEGDGIHGQISSCQRYCLEHHLEVVGTYFDEGVSGKTIERKGLKTMIAFIKTKNKHKIEIDYVIVNDLDRISRDLGGRVQIKKDIEEYGKASILNTKGGIEKNSNTELQDNIMMAFAEHRRIQNAERVVERQTERLLDGYRTFYRIPGYTYKKDTNRGGKILIQDNNAPIIAYGLEKYANNVISSITDLILFFEEEGLTTIQNNKKIKYDFVKRMLTKDRLLLYAGYINLPKRNITMIQGKHTPIITLDIVDKIQQKHHPKSYKISENHHVNKEIVLRNYLYCEYCNKPLTGGPSVGKLGKKYYYYRCHNIECSHYGKSLNASDVNKDFSNYLKQFTLDKGFIDLLKEITKEIYFEEKDTNKQETLKAQLTHISTKIRKLQDMILSCENPTILQQYEASFETLLLDKKKLEEDISKINMKKISLNDIEKEIDFIVEGYSDLYKLRKGGDVEKQRLLIGVVFGGKIFFNKKKGIGTPETCFTYSCLNAFKQSNSHLVEVMGFEPMSESHIIQHLPS